MATPHACTAKCTVVTLLSGLGVAAVILGGFAPGYVQQRAIDKIANDVRVYSFEACSYGPDVSKKCSAESTGSSQYYLYNITNALAMVEHGATPSLTEVHVGKLLCAARALAVHQPFCVFAKFTRVHPIAALPCPNRSGLGLARLRCAVF